MPQKKPVNPFYVVAIVVGVAFAITACSYCVMTMRGLDPHAVGENGLVGVMDRYGLAIMLVELGVLGAATVAAIATDDYWIRRFEAREQQRT